MVIISSSILQGKNKYNDSNELFCGISAKVDIPGGINNSGIILDGERIIVVEMDHEISKNGDSATAHLSELFLIIGDAKYQAQNFRIDSTIKTKQYEMDLAGYLF